MPAHTATGALPSGEGRGSAPQALQTRLGALGWDADPALAYRDWVSEGRRIGQLWRASPWWIGDWLLFGTNRWGEMYAQAAKITGYDRKSLRNMRYVSSRFALSLRKDNLTWSHHALLTSLQPEEQRRWLERAISERLSVEDLRIELRSSRDREDLGDSFSEPPTARRGAVSLICPACGGRVPLTAERAARNAAGRPADRSQERSLAVPA